VPVAVTRGKPTGAKPPAPTKSAPPLVPLHLRPPIQNRLKPGAAFFGCPCGERLLLRAGDRPEVLQCPACDRRHRVEFEAEAPARTSTSPAAPKAAPARPLNPGEFVCKCGAVQPPRSSRSGKAFVCAACGRKGSVEPVADPKTGKIEIRPTFTEEPEEAPTAGEPSWSCSCGHSIPARAVLLKTIQACPACRRPIRMEQTRDSRAGRTLIRPVFDEPAPAMEAAVFEAAPAPEPEVAFEELPPLEEGPPSIDPDAAAVACGCGAELLLTRSLLGETIQCPACGADQEVVQASGGALALRPVR
jgi:hypothetical protein